MLDATCMNNNKASPLFVYIVDSVDVWLAILIYLNVDLIKKIRQLNLIPIMVRIIGLH